jgi:dUTP pyrophosphatase
MKVKIKKVRESAFLPTKAHDTDAGYDLYADTKCHDDDGNVVYGTGVAVEIPKGYVGLVFPRSSIAKQDILLSNSVGVIDSGYRGEIMAKFKPTHIAANPIKLWWQAHVLNKKTLDLVQSSIHRNEYEIGDRIAQLIIMPYPEVEFEEVNELSNSDRGVGGYGSSGA